MLVVQLLLLVILTHMLIQIIKLMVLLLVQVISDSYLKVILQRKKIPSLVVLVMIHFKLDLVLLQLEVLVNQLL